jgi:hypothetical protein
MPRRRIASLAGSFRSDLRGRRRVLARAVLAIVVVATLGGLAAATQARSEASGPAQAVQAVPPVAAQIDSYSGAVTNGASQNDLYLFLVAHAGQVVHVDVQVSSAVKVQMTGNPRTITLSSGCGGTKPPANCDRALRLAGTSYVIYDASASSGVTVTSSNGIYTVTGYLAIGQPTQDSKGMYALPVRAVAPGGPAMADNDE